MICWKSSVIPVSLELWRGLVEETYKSKESINHASKQAAFTPRNVFYHAGHSAREGKRERRKESKRKQKGTF